MWGRYGSWGFLNVEVDCLVSIISPSIQMLYGAESPGAEYVKRVNSDEDKCSIAARNYRRIVYCRGDALKVVDSF